MAEISKIQPFGSTTQYDIVDSNAPRKDGTGASGAWGINITGNAATATKLSSTGTTGQFWRGDNSWSNQLTGPLNINGTNGGPYLTINYNSTRYADDKTLDNNGLNLIKFGMSSMDNYLGTCLNTNYSLANKYQYAFHTSSTCNYGWFTSSWARVMELDNALRTLHIIGTGNNGGRLNLIGKFNSTNLKLTDVDRPGINISGYYPQIALIAGGVDNANHGSTITLAGYDEATATSGNFKAFTFGTPRKNVTWMDLGYGENKDNPHANGINAYQGTHIMRWQSDGKIGIGTRSPDALVTAQGQAVDSKGIFHAIDTRTDAGWHYPFLGTCANLAVGGNMYICIGKAASTGNAAGLRYNWQATSSDSNLMGFEFYGKGTKLWVYENGNGGVSGTWSWNGIANGSINGNAATATTATNLANAPSIPISGNTIAVTAGGKTSSYITVPYATNCDTVDGEHSSSFLHYGGVIDTHGEGNDTIILDGGNELFALYDRGGTCTAYEVSIDTTDFTTTLTSLGALSQLPASVFSGRIGYTGGSYSGSNFAVYDLKLASSLNYGQHFFWSFGNGSWKCTKMRILTSVNGETWKLCYNTDSCPAYGHVSISPPSGVTTYYLRIVMDKYSRLSTIGATQYNSLGLATTYMSRSIDDQIYRSITPGKSTTYNLGSSTNKWNEIYGTLKGNADSATALTTNAGSTTNPVYFTSGKPSAVNIISSGNYKNGFASAFDGNGYGEIATGLDWHTPTSTNDFDVRLALDQTNKRLCIQGVGSGWNNAFAATNFYGALKGNADTATKLSNTPNNTTTFLRGDNTWTNILTSNLYIGGTSTNISSSVTSGVTTQLQLIAGTGGNTNYTAISFHNPGISSATFGYQNIDANNALFRYRSDDSYWDIAIGGTKKLSTSWSTANMTVGADGNNKAVIGYLPTTSTNGVVFGAHNSDLSAWAPVNIAGTQINIRENENIRAKWLDGCLSLFPTNSNYREGLRIHPYGSWSDITLCGDDNTGDTGISANSWFIGNNNGNFYITRNGSNTADRSTLRCVNNVWSWNGIASGSISGNAATATKLGTSTVGSANRGIYLNSGTATALTWYPDYCTISGGNKANWPWHRIATVDTGTGTYVDKDVIMCLRSRYNGGAYGVIKLSVRTNANGAAIDIGARWLIRTGYAVDSIKIAKTGNSTGTNTTIDVYLRCGTWPRAYGYIMQGSNNGWSLISSTEVDNTTVDDKLTSTEVYNDINRVAYNAVIDAIDVGTVNYANSAGSCTGNAATATALTSSAGSSTVPIYFSDGKPVQCSTTLGVSITGNAATATKLSNTPNNTTTFLRGDNTWSNTLTGTTTNFSTPILTIKSTSNNTWTPGISQLAENLTAGNYVGLTIGKTLGTKNNTAHLSFYYAGDQSTDNRCALGFYNTIDLLVVKADGNVGIGTTSPSSKLHISNGLLKVTNNSNTVTIGSGNTSYCHFENSADIPFYFNKPITVNGQLRQYPDAVISQSWINGRDSAAVRVTNFNNYHAGLSMKTTNGSYEIGVYTNDNFWITYCPDSNYNSNNNNGYKQVHMTSSGQWYGAVWNDYAEYRKDNLEEIQEPGRCVYEIGDGTLALTTERLMRGCEIISDTFGFAIGQDENNGYNTPVASSGRVLAYPYEDLEEFKKHIGYAVCSGPNGTVSIMTDEEEERYPLRAIGTISEVPDYEEWGSGNIKVNGRVWIRIR